jgi:hypothetical protein
MINPEVVIESGVFKGQSTWLIEKVCPTARIISIDPDLSRVAYVSPKAQYTTTDFNTINWKLILGSSISKTLAFIDDHQNNYERLKTAYNAGIPYMIFEDNYPTLHGDVLSLKKVIMNNYYIYEMKDTKNPTSERKAIPPEYKINVTNICEYIEAPPVYLDSPVTRWGDAFALHQCQPPVFSELEDGLEIFKEDQLDYTFIALVKIHKNVAGNDSK